MQEHGCIPEYDSTEKTFDASDCTDVYLCNTGCPSEPRHLRITRVTKDSVELTWDSPASNGGSNIIHYVVEKQDSKTSWTQLASVVGQTTRCVISELNMREEYSLHVYAVNEVGRRSQPCEPVSYYIDVPLGKLWTFTHRRELGYHKLYEWDCATQRVEERSVPVWERAVFEYLSDWNRLASRQETLYVCLHQQCFIMYQERFLWHEKWSRGIDKIGTQISSLSRLAFIISFIMSLFKVPIQANCMLTDPNSAIKAQKGPFEITLTTIYI